MLTSKVNAAVAVYPRKTPRTVTGMRILATRSLILKNRSRSNVTPNTQPTWGRALKTMIIETINPQVVKIEIFSRSCTIKNRQANAEITQNSVALSLRPRIDQTKWLGMKTKIENKLKKIRGFCSVNCANFACLKVILRTIEASKQTSKKP